MNTEKDTYILNPEQLLGAIPDHADGAIVRCAFGSIMIAESGRISVQFASENEERILISGERPKTNVSISVDEFNGALPSAPSSLVMFGENDQALAIICDPTDAISLIGVMRGVEEDFLHLAEDMVPIEHAKRILLAN